MPQIQPAGRLTTHVLDTATGRPAIGLRIVLSRLDPAGPVQICETHTNADGRCDGPLLAGAAMEAGRYEMVFHVGEYLARTLLALPHPPFLDDVPVRFGISDVALHYHVPLLVSPFAYSTYRGS